MDRLRWAAPAIIAVLSVLAVSVRADTVALESWSDPDFLYMHNYTLGWKFTLASPVEVTQLGLWDSEQNGLTDSHHIRIWSSSGDQVFADATLPATSVQGQQWHWVSMASPTLLPAGTYVIGAHFATAFDLAVLKATGVTTAPGVTCVECRNSASDVFPVADPSREKAYFGPNFRFQDPNPVPEPAFLQLPFLVALGGAGLWWRRRARG